MSEFIMSLLMTLRSLDLSLLVGFITAWLLFEVTERRRMRLAQRELSRALIAELQNGEVLASITVIKYARLCKSDKDVVSVAGEIRWYMDVGRQRFGDFGVLSMPSLPAIPAEFGSLSDKELVGLFSHIKETIGVKIIMPVLDKALAGQTLGFSAGQIQA